MNSHNNPAKEATYKLFIEYLRLFNPILAVRIEVAKIDVYKHVIERIQAFGYHDYVKKLNDHGSPYYRQLLAKLPS